MKKVLLFSVFILVGVGCFKADVWTGFYYPEGCLSCSETTIEKTGFSSQFECLNWAYETKVSLNDPEGMFECGLNCRNEGGLNICERTLD